MRAFRFVLKIFPLCVATLFCAPAAGQSTADLALKNLQRQKWQRSYELLTKALAKDSLNVTAKYVLAQYFFSEGNPALHLDSAYQHVLGALNEFQKATSKQRERLLRFPLDSFRLVTLRNQIDGAAFIRAQILQTENSWNHFIDHFTTSPYISQALELRDSIAYEDAAKENTYQSFQAFLQKYPASRQAVRAQNNYEKLLLSVKTADQTLTSFETFLAEFPNTSYRTFVEQTIFEYRTASGEYQSFVEFVRSYPQNSFVQKAKNILYHLIPENEREQKWPAEFITDSLTAVIKLEKNYLIPFRKNKKFGFMDAEGNEIIPAQADSLDQAYLCGNIEEDILLLPDKIIAKNGSCLWNEKVIKIDELGFGFLLLEGQSCTSLIHKSGFKIGENCIDEAKILNGKFIGIKKEDHWSIWTLSGRQLLQDIDEVFYIGEVIGLKRKGRIKLIPAAALAVLPSPGDFINKPEYDEVQSWNNGLIFVRNDEEAALLDQQLDIVVPWDNHILTPTFFGAQALTPSGLRLYAAGQNTKPLQAAILQDPWVAAKDSLWGLMDPGSLTYFTALYDTIIFAGPYPIGYKRDSCDIFFSQQQILKGMKPTSIEFVPGKDSLSFLMVDREGQRSIYDHFGRKLFTATFDRIQYAADGIFIVYKNEKRGLMTTKGKLLLPIEYDAIGMASNGTMSLLKSVKFGLFDFSKKKQIQPAYTKNLVPYNNGVISAYKNGFYGFIGWDNKALSKFEFREIQFWNDTTALVKKDSHWMLYEIKTGKILMDKIKDYSLIRNTPTEKLAVIYQDANHGVIHSRAGTLIPISFSDIINVGSAEKPFYFTEKHIEEASIFVVIYYNDQGQMLRKEIYDHEDYDKIYCHQN